MTRTRVLAPSSPASPSPASVPPPPRSAATTPLPPAPVTVVAQTRAATPAGTSTANAPAPATDAVSADEAGARAVAHLRGGAVTKVEREVEHGRTVWKVDVRRDSRLTEAHVDVATGTVTRITDDGRTDDDRSDDHAGRHGSDDGPGHDRFDDKGGDR